MALTNIKTVFLNDQPLVVRDNSVEVGLGERYKTQVDSLGISKVINIVVVADEPDYIQFSITNNGNNIDVMRVALDNMKNGSFNKVSIITNEHTLIINPAYIIGTQTLKFSDNPEIDGLKFTGNLITNRTGS